MAFLMTAACSMQRNLQTLEDTRKPWQHTSRMASRKANTASRSKRPCVTGREGAGGTGGRHATVAIASAGQQVPAALETQALTWPAKTSAQRILEPQRAERIVIDSYACRLLTSVCCLTRTANSGNKLSRTRRVRGPQSTLQTHLSQGTLLLARNALAEVRGGDAQLPPQRAAWVLQLIQQRQVRRHVVCRHARSARLRKSKLIHCLSGSRPGCSRAQGKQTG